MASVAFENVTKQFGNVVAVKDLTLYIPDGEFLVLVGPSGCGKTTTLRLLAGLEEVTRGRIYIGDRDVTEIPPKDRNIAMVFQSYALYPHMNVYDNIAFGLRMRKVPKPEIERRVREAARMLEIEHLLDRKPRQLSGGQRQRDPAVFLFDEPLSNLDAKLRVQTRAELIKLHQRLGTTFVYVTHDQVEAMTMGTRIAVMKDGVLQQVDTPQNLYERPDNLFVAGFIGSPPMNFFESRLVLEGDTLWVDTGAFRVPVPPDRAPVYRPYVGRRVIFGLRPEHIYDPEFAPPLNHPAQVQARVDVRELMGSEVHLHLVADRQLFVARVDPRSRALVGNTVMVLFDMDRMHLFD
ncbi:MAG: glycerol-3-phosphate ABC transporter ATP-binding protein, partial [Thermoflexus sp.]